MSGYKTDQRHVLHRGREFHFVSYEGHAANPDRGQEAMPPTWFLMQAGKRWEATPQKPDQDPDAVDAMLVRWLEAEIFTAEAEADRARRPRPRARHRPR